MVPKLHRLKLWGFLLIALLGFTNFGTDVNKSCSLKGAGNEIQKGLRVAGIKSAVSDDIAVKNIFLQLWMGRRYQ